MENKISKNLLELIYSLIQEQINDESAKIIKEIINSQNSSKKISKTDLIKNFSIKKELNNKKINIDNLFERLINLNYIGNKNINEEIVLKIDNILNILLYPRYCYYINCLYGPKNLKIIEYLLEFGLYSIDSVDNNENKNINFTRDDFNTLVRDGIIIKNNYQKSNIKSITTDNNKDCENNNIFEKNIKEIYIINYNLLNEIIFKEYIINFYKNYISMNFKFYELFKKVVNSDYFSYELKNYENNLLDYKINDNYDFDKLLIKENNKIVLNIDMIKYDLFYNSIEKIVNVLYSSKHIRILKIIQRYENLNIFQIAQKACLKSIEVEEILNDLIYKVKIIKKIKKLEINDKNDDINVNINKNNIEDIFCLNEINETHINEAKDKIYDIIKNIKFEIKDKLKELQGRISKETQIQFINKYYSLINSFSEILNSYNFLFEKNNR